MDVVTGHGAFYFFIPIMINFIVTINEILREKQKRLRSGKSKLLFVCSIVLCFHSCLFMIYYPSITNPFLLICSIQNLGITTMGLGNFSYWSSWVISSLILTITTSSIQIICGKVFGFDIFTKTPFLILLFFLVSYGMSINVIGYLITNVCTDTANG